MTTFFDDLRQGRANYDRAVPPATGYAEDEIYGVPHTQTYAEELGTASTALATGIFYTTTGGAAGAHTLAGALVTAGVATFDVARGVRITASVNLSTVTITFEGTDTWGAPLVHSVLGPTGNTLGNAGSYRDTLSAFKTINTASSNGSLGTTAVYFGDNNAFGFSYKLTNVGKSLGLFVDGTSATTAPTVVAGLATTITPGATTADVRGTCTLSTTDLANGAKYFTIQMITPNYGITEGSDTKEISYGDAPYTV